MRATWIFSSGRVVGSRRLKAAAPRRPRISTAPPPAGEIKADAGALFRARNLERSEHLGVGPNSNIKRGHAVLSKSPGTARYEQSAGGSSSASESRVSTTSPDGTAQDGGTTTPAHA